MRLTQADPCRKIVLLWIKECAPSFFTSFRVRACAMLDDATHGRVIGG